MDIKDTISRVPTWGWIAGGGLAIGLVLLMNRGNAATTMNSTGGVAPDANSLLQQLQDAAGAAGGGGGSSSGSGSSGTGGTTTTTPPTSGTTQTLSGYTAKIKNTSGIKLYSSPNGKYVSSLYNITVSTAIPKKVNGLWWYQITSGKYKGLFFKPTSGITWTKIFTSTPTTTTSTSTVSTSNNAVA